MGFKKGEEGYIKGQKRVEGRLKRNSIMVTRDTVEKGVTKGFKKERVKKR